MLATARRIYTERYCNMKVFYVDHKFLERFDSQVLVAVIPQFINIILPCWRHAVLWSGITPWWQLHYQHCYIHFPCHLNLIIVIISWRCRTWRHSFGRHCKSHPSLLDRTDFKFLPFTAQNYMHVFWVQWFIQTPPGGVITPQFSCDTPQQSEVQGGLSGGVYGGCLCDRDGRGQILTWTSLFTLWNK